MYPNVGQMMGGSIPVQQMPQPTMPPQMPAPNAPMPNMPVSPQLVQQQVQRAMPQRSQQDAQMNPSVGQLLSNFGPAGQGSQGGY